MRTIFLMFLVGPGAIKVKSASRSRLWAGTRETTPAGKVVILLLINLDGDTETAGLERVALQSFRILNRSTCGTTRGRATIVGQLFSIMHRGNAALVSLPQPITFDRIESISWECQSPD